MTQDGSKRKLAAILSADVKGYSILMSADETFTVKTLKAYRSLMSEQIEQHSGRVVDSPGDNMLAEFASAVDAVECAVKIQKVLKKENEDLPLEKRLEFRIGVNIGDVIQDQDSLYGEGVNIAARIEGLADAGGVCISRNAYDHISNKLNYGYEYLGEHSVKNIEKPVRVYKVLMASEDAGKLIGDAPKPAAKKWIWATVLLAVIVITSIVWQAYKKIGEPDFEPVRVENMAFPLPEKPSIAVLPFDNLSDDPEQEYFSDGMTDDIITDISKIKSLLVISRNSTFTYKGKDVKIPEVAKELNVRYVLEGSVRRSGDQVRINAQLIDAKTDHHIWADRFDGKIENIFKLQDSITLKIVSALSLTLAGKEQSTISIIETSNIQAYDLVLKGISLIRQNTPQSYADASNLLQKAVKLDPNYSRAYAELANLYWTGASSGVQFWKALNIDYHVGRQLGISYLDVAMRNPTPKAHQIATFVALSRRQFETAANEAQKAIELNPNDSAGYAALSNVYMDARPEDAISYAKMELKLDPQSLPDSLNKQGRAYFFLKNYEKTVELIERAGVHSQSLIYGNAFLVAAYVYLDRHQDAIQAYKGLFLKPYGGDIPIPEHIIHYYCIQKPENATRLINGLIKAGMPSQPDKYCRLSDDEKISYEEVKKLVIGNTWTGHFWSLPRNQWRNHFSIDGVNTVTVQSKTFKREYGFHDELIYVFREVQGRKLKSVWTIYRNKHGAYDEKNEYILIHENMVAPFSVQKEK